MLSASSLLALKWHSLRVSLTGHNREGLNEHYSTMVVLLKNTFFYFSVYYLEWIKQNTFSAIQPAWHWECRHTRINKGKARKMQVVSLPLIQVMRLAVFDRILHLRRNFLWTNRSREYLRAIEAWRYFTANQNITTNINFNYNQKKLEIEISTFIIKHRFGRT